MLIKLLRLLALSAHAMSLEIGTEPLPPGPPK